MCRYKKRRRSGLRLRFLIVFDRYYSIVSRQSGFHSCPNRHGNLSNIIGAVIAPVGWPLQINRAQPSCGFNAAFLYIFHKRSHRLACSFIRPAIVDAQGGCFVKFHALGTVKALVHRNTAHKVKRTGIIRHAHGEHTRRHGHFSGSGGGNVGVPQFNGCLGNILTLIFPTKAHLTRQNGFMHCEIALLCRTHLKHLNISVQHFPQLIKLI